MPHGGIGTFTKIIAESLILKGHDILIVGYGDKKFTYRLVLNGVQTVRLKNKKSDYGVILNYLIMLISRVVFYKNILKYTAEFKPDLIETYDWSAPLIFKPGKVPLIMRLHGSNTANNLYVGLRRTAVLYWMERKAILQADHIISVSDHIAEITQKSFGINFNYKTIYNGVDTTHFVNRKNKRDINKILLVGRMHPYKGFDILFKAMTFLFSNHPTLHFQIICTVIESYKKELLSYVNPIFHRRIEFLGRIPNSLLIDYYNEANLSVLPSKAEAFPIIPLESMACGTPVIMANRFSAKEIIDDGIDGFLVDITNTEVFANRILDILTNQNLIEAMREKSRTKILEKFSIEKIINYNIDFYKSVLV
jgi:glycosyltransferase involved in cell wall biosynthesis